MDSDNVEYNGVRFEIPEYGGEGIILHPAAPEAEIDRENPIVKCADTIWDIANFKTAREPIVVGEVEDLARFDKVEEGAKRTLDMPIKFPGTDYRLPAELAQYKDVLEKMMGFEHAINDGVDDYYAYLTLDFGEVQSGTTQRKGGCHVDGFQGERINPKNRINRSYVVSNVFPTVFYPQSFDIQQLDVATQNVFHEFDKQADESKAFRPKPYEIALMDAYTVHRADQATRDAARVFIRLSYDVLKFDRLGNTKNPLFDYDWEMVPREAQKNLS